MDKCVQLQSSATAAKGRQSLAPHDSPSQSTTTFDQSAVLLLNFSSPFQQIITMGQCPAPPRPPPKSTADQGPASPDPSVKPKSKEDQHPASPASLVEQNSTADQHPASSDCLVESTNTSDCPAGPPDPLAQPTTPVVHPFTCTANTVRQTGRVQRKIKCSMCNLYLHKKNLRKHKLRKHLISEKDITAKEHLRGQCVDSHNGVYAVAKSYKNSAVPVHVIKNGSGSIHKMMCDEELCKVISDYQRRSGLPWSQCPHLRSVDFCFTCANQEDLKPGVLEELVASNLIQKGMKAKCLNHRDQAIQNSAPLVALVDVGGSHCLYLSVFEPKVAQYGKVGRLFVTYNLRGRLWHCDCSQGRICLHKCTAKWYLFQTNKKLFSSAAKRVAPLSVAEFMDDRPAETSTGKSTGNVCLLGEEGLKQMAKYIYNRKKLPSTFPKSITQFESEAHFSKQLVPVETVCQECPGQVFLTEPVLITNKARVITLTGVMEGLSVVRLTMSSFCCCFGCSCKFMLCFMSCRLFHIFQKLSRLQNGIPLPGVA